MGLCLWKCGLMRLRWRHDAAVSNIIVLYLFLQSGACRTAAPVDQPRRAETNCCRGWVQCLLILRPAPCAVPKMRLWAFARVGLGLPCAGLRCGFTRSVSIIARLGKRGIGTPIG